MNQFEVVNIEQLFSEYQIFENIPPRGSLPSAWKNFVIGAKAVLQELNAVSSKFNNILKIGTMGVQVTYNGNYNNSLDSTISELNSDLNYYASLYDPGQRLAGKRDFIGYVQIYGRCDFGGGNNRYNIDATLTTGNGLMFNNIQLPYNTPVQVKFTRCGYDSDINIFYTTENPENFRQNPDNFGEAYKFFNFGLNYVGENSWVTLNIGQGFQVKQILNENFDQTGEDINTCIFPYSAADFDFEIPEWSDEYEQTQYTCRYGFSMVAWYVDLTQIFKFT